MKKNIFDENAIDQQPADRREKRETEYSKDESGEIKKYVNDVKKMFPAELNHIEPDMIDYLFFSKPTSSRKASIRSVKGILTAYNKTKSYIIEVHKETWDTAAEEERYYITKHELLHIHEEGFIEGADGCKKLVPHDLIDFKSLVNECGVYQENIFKVFKLDEEK